MSCILVLNNPRNNYYPLTVVSPKGYQMESLKISLFFLVKAGLVVNCSQDEFILARALYIDV